MSGAGSGDSAGGAEGTPSFGEPGPLPSNMRFSDDVGAEHSYCEVDAKLFKVRGKSYLKDNVKIPSGPSAMQLIGCDMFTSRRRLSHVAILRDGFVQRARRAGFTGQIMVINIQLPMASDSWMFQVSYFTPRAGVIESDPAFAALFRRLLEDDSDNNLFRNSRLKFIPIIVDGPWFVKKAVPQKPALIGNKLDLEYFRGDDHFEIDVNVGSSVVARKIMGIAAGAATSLVVDMAWTIQGESDAELPERVLGAFRLIHVDLTVPPEFDCREATDHLDQSHESIVVSGEC